MVLGILEDKREITGVAWNDEWGSQVSVGHNGVTRIEAYGEPGEHSLIPWLAVYKGEILVSRIPAGQVQISYKEVL